MMAQFCTMFSKQSEPEHWQYCVHAILRTPRTAGWGSGFGAIDFNALPCPWLQRDFTVQSECFPGADSSWCEWTDNEPAVISISILWLTWGRYDGRENSIFGWTMSPPFQPEHPRMLRARRQRYKAIALSKLRCSGQYLSQLLAIIDVTTYWMVPGLQMVLSLVFITTSRHTPTSGSKKPTDTAGLHYIIQRILYATFKPT